MLWCYRNYSARIAPHAHIQSHALLKLVRTFPSEQCYVRERSIAKVAREELLVFQSALQERDELLRGEVWKRRLEKLAWYRLPK